MRLSVDFTKPVTRWSRGVWWNLWNRRITGARPDDVFLSSSDMVAADVPVTKYVSEGSLSLCVVVSLARLLSITHLTSSVRYSKRWWEKHLSHNGNLRTPFYTVRCVTPVRLIHCVWSHLKTYWAYKLRLNTWGQPRSQGYCICCVKSIKKKIHNVQLVAGTPCCILQFSLNPHWGIQLLLSIEGPSQLHIFCLFYERSCTLYESKL